MSGEANLNDQGQGVDEFVEETSLGSKAPEERENDDEAMVEIVITPPSSTAKLTPAEAFPRITASMFSVAPQVDAGVPIASFSWAARRAEWTRRPLDSNAAAHKQVSSNSGKPSSSSVWKMVSEGKSMEANPVPLSDVIACLNERMNESDIVGLGTDDVDTMSTSEPSTPKSSPPSTHKSPSKSDSSPGFMNSVGSRVIRWAGQKLAKNLQKGPELMQAGLSEEAKDLVTTCFGDLDPTLLTDYHAHVVGYGSGGTGCCVPDVTEREPRGIKKLSLAMMAEAAGVRDHDTADKDFIARLLRLTQAIRPHGKHAILAFAKHWNEDGTENMERTEFYTPNEYIYELALAHTDTFLPTCSVHPYDPTAIEQLELWASRGVKLIKWLPNSQGMNPGKVSDEYYDTVKRLGMVILSHTGDEKAVDSHPEAQGLGNPLLLRHALDHGVRVIMAHCASLGNNRDLDDASRPLVSNFSLFLRMMGNPKYEGLLFADISATTQFNRIDCLVSLLKRTDFHHRLLNGTDYPLPLVKLLTLTRPLVKRGLLTANQRTLLNEIYQFNPLIFDFCLKRCLRGPEHQSFPVSLFIRNPKLAIWEDWERLHPAVPPVSFPSSQNPAMLNEEQCAARIHKCREAIAVLDDLKAEKVAELGALQSHMQEIKHVHIFTQ